jgi:hypothetical protein
VIRGWSRAAAAVITVGACLACAGTVEQARLVKEGLMPGENRKACAQWVEHVNGLDACLRVTYDLDNVCGGVDDVGADLVPWFQCLREHTACDGDVPAADWDSCPAPLRAPPDPAGEQGSVGVQG